MEITQTYKRASKRTVFPPLYDPNDLILATKRLKVWPEPTPIEDWNAAIDHEYDRITIPAVQVEEPESIWDAWLSGEIESQPEVEIEEVSLLADWTPSI